jgi:hypothetical protein
MPSGDGERQLRRIKRRKRKEQLKVNMGIVKLKPKKP